MEEKIISNVDGVAIYGVISIGIFFIFFSGLLVWAFRRKKSYLDRMGALPLDGGERRKIGEQTNQRKSL
jgi:hypothetical protein